MREKISSFAKAIKERNFSAADNQIEDIVNNEEFFKQTLHTLIAVRYIASANEAEDINKAASDLEKVLKAFTALSKNNSSANIDAEPEARAVFSEQFLLLGQYFQEKQQTFDTGKAIAQALHFTDAPDIKETLVNSLIHVAMKAAGEENHAAAYILYQQLEKHVRPVLHSEELADFYGELGAYHQGFKKYSKAIASYEAAEAASGADWKEAKAVCQDHLGKLEESHAVASGVGAEYAASPARISHVQRVQAMLVKAAIQEPDRESRATEYQDAKHASSHMLAQDRPDGMKWSDVIAQKRNVVEKEEKSPLPMVAKVEAAKSASFIPVAAR